MARKKSSGAGTRKTRTSRQNNTKPIGLFLWYVAQDPNLQSAFQQYCKSMLQVYQPPTAVATMRSIASRCWSAILLPPRKHGGSLVDPVKRLSCQPIWMVSSRHKLAIQTTTSHGHRVALLFIRYGPTTQTSQLRLTRPLRWKPVCQ